MTLMDQKSKHQFKKNLALNLIFSNGLSTEVYIVIYFSALK